MSITKENIAEVLSSLDKDAIKSAMDYPSDWVMIQLNTFNAGWYATINGVDYTEDLEEEVKNNGDLFIQKDQLELLFTENELEL
jgi:hypothetical protein